MEPKTELYERAASLMERLDRIYFSPDYRARDEAAFIAALDDVRAALDCPSWAAVALATDAVMRIEAAVAKGGA